ncbi:MAG: TonB-dependent receptor [Gammaproteobacteria bacterium]|nr:TonB-dependent receptor [Gammaproteobacteria bacterium]
MLNFKFCNMRSSAIFLPILAALLAPAPVAADLLEEVIVTAQKREESLQDVSVSVTAFSREVLRDIGLTNSNDLGQYVPGVVIAPPSGNQQAKSFIRGSGAVDFAANTQTTVGVYVDEVYLHNTFMHTMQTFDLERIEVLRGPQGTLYGRNATGGAINYITAKPTQEFSGYAQAGYGSYDAVKFEGAVSGPLTDTLAGRIAGTYSNGGGWMKGRTDLPGTVGGDFNEVDFYSWRGTLEWAPQDNVQVLWSVNGSQDRSDAYSYQHAGVAVPGSYEFNPVTFAETFELCDATLRDDCVNFFGYQDPDGVEERGDPTAGDFDLHDEVDFETIGTTLRLEWDLQYFTVTSISAYNKFQRYLPGEEDGSPYLLTHNFYRHDTDGWSQELRAASTTDGLFDWLLGFYYAEDELNSYNEYQFRTFGSTFQWFDQNQEALAVFANAGFQLNDRLKLSAGLRYTRDEVDLRHRSTHPDPNDFVPPIPQVPFDPGTSGARTYEDVSWKVGIDYTPNDDWLVYASVGTGYKSGGINVGFASPEEFNIYDEETLLAVEGGFKSTWWDGRARLNVSAFYYNYEDLQVFDQTQGPFGAILIIGNAPQADYYGAEVEFLVNPAQRLEVLFGLSHLDTEFGAFGRPITGEDLTGNSNVYSPEWKFTGLARYEWPTPALMGGKVAASFNWSWTDEVFHTIENRSDVRAKSHWLVGARVSWFSADESLELAFWGKNLSNTAYRVQTFDFRNSGWHTLVPNTPRMVGGEIVYSW